MRDDYPNPASPEFERMPYPLIAPEAPEEPDLQALGEEAILLLEDLEEHLRGLAGRWTATAQRERAKLATHHPPHDIPMEYRAGLAEGLSKAARDLDRMLARVHRHNAGGEE